MVFTASMLGAQHSVEVVENKPASSLVVSLGKTLKTGRPLLNVEDMWPSFPSEERVGGRKGIRLKKKAMS